MMVTPEFLNCILGGGVVLLMGMLLGLIASPYSRGLLHDLLDALALRRKGD